MLLTKTQRSIPEGRSILLFFLLKALLGLLHESFSVHVLLLIMTDKEVFVIEFYKTYVVCPDIEGH